MNIAGRWPEKRPIHCPIPDSSSHPYLISTLPQFDLIKRFKLIAMGSITAFFVAGGISVWMFGTRFGG